MSIAAPVSARSPERKPLLLPTLLLCLCIIGLEGYDIQAFGVAAPHMMAEIGLGADAQGWIGSAAMAGLIAGAFAGGILSRFISQRIILFVAMLAFGSCSILTAMLSDIASLLTVRFLAGVGFGGALPLVIAIVGEVASERRRALAVTVAFCGLPAGAAIVALYAHSMMDGVDWRSIFISGGIPPILLAPFIFWLMPRQTGTVAEKSSGVMHDLLGQGRMLATLLVWVTFATTLLIVYLMLNWLPSLVITKGLPPADGASAAFIFNIASIAGALMLAVIVDRVGFRWPLCAAYVALTVVLAIMSISDDQGLVLLLAAMAGFLVVGPQCALYALIPWIYPPHARALGAGASVGMGRLGSIAGPLIAGQMRAGGHSADAVFLFLAPVPLIAAAAVLLLGSPRLRTIAHGNEGEH